MQAVFYDSGTGSLGIQYLVSVLKQVGHEASVYYDPSLSRDYITQNLFLRRVFSRTPEKVANGLNECGGQVVGFSMTSYNYTQSLILVKELKKCYPEKIIVCGGIHVTILPEVVLRNPEIDFAVVGEGELAMTALMNALSAMPLDAVKRLPETELKGVWNTCDGTVIRRGVAPLVHEIDSLPFPDKTDYQRINSAFNKMYSIGASRGCHYGCTFCNSPSVRNMYKETGQRYVRLRSVDNVIAELRHAKDLYHPRFVEFYDDLFGINEEWLREFHARYPKEVGIPFGAETNPLLLSKERLRLMAESGCKCLEIGFQSANEEVRRRLMHRYEKNTQVCEVVKEARSLGIFVELDFIVNMPDEKPEHLDEVLEFIREARPNLANISFLQFFPGTPITLNAFKEGRITPEEFASIENGEGFTIVRLASNQGPRYLLFPYEAFFAQTFSPALSRRLGALVLKPGLRFLFGLAVNPFVYVTRFGISLLDSRPFFSRWHILRLYHSARGIFRRAPSQQPPPTSEAEV